MWVCLETKKAFKESGYYDKPRSIPRWYRNTDSWNGYSPALLAKPDVKTLNEVARLDLTAWEKAIDPPILTEDQNLVGDMNIAAGKMTTVNDINGTKVFQEGSNHQLTAYKSEEKKASVRNLMFTDIIRDPLGDTGQKTAYEVAQRRERANRLLGQGTSPLTTEYLVWRAERVFGIMLRNGRFPEMPVELDGMDVELDIRAVTPMAISQQSAKLDNIDGFISRLSMIAQSRTPQAPGSDPVWDYFDDTAYVTEIKEVQNIPATIVVGDDEVKQVRDGRAQAQQQAAAMDQAGKAAGVVKDIGAGAGPEAGETARGKMEQLAAG
jgi:hypothetical protein